MAVGSTRDGHDGIGDDPPVFDDTWAQAGVKESGLRRRTSPPAPSSAPPGLNVTGAPAGPRDWVPRQPVPVRRRRGSARTALVLIAAAITVLVAFATRGGGSTTTRPVAGGNLFPTTSPSPHDTRPSIHGLENLDIGACFDLLGSRTQRTLDKSCSRPHRFQLVGTERATGSDARYPSSTYWDGPVRRRCDADLVAFARQPTSRWPPRLELEVFFPRPDSWARGDRDVFCGGTEGPSTTGSLRDLHPYTGSHAPITMPPALPAASPPESRSPVASRTSSVRGTLGLVHAGTQVCLTLTGSGTTVVLEPMQPYGVVWLIHDGVPDRAGTGITTGTSPQDRTIVRQLGSIVTLTGSYTAPTSSDCGAVRPFAFSGVR